MARPEALIALTHDHHHFHAHTRRLEAAVSEDDAARGSAADDFVSFYLDKVSANMREEQELFFPAAFRDGRAHDLILRAVKEHLEIHDCAKRLQRELSVQRLVITGEELYSIIDLEGSEPLPCQVTVPVEKDGQFTATVRLDTRRGGYFRHGGILQYVLCQLAAS